MPDGVATSLLPTCVYRQETSAPAEVVPSRIAAGDARPVRVLQSRHAGAGLMHGQRLLAGGLRWMPCQPELAHEIEGIERRFHLDVIVEVDIDVAPVLVPVADAPRPARERALGIAAGLDFDVAMQAHKDEGGG